MQLHCVQSTFSVTRSMDFVTFNCFFFFISDKGIVLGGGVPKV